MNIISIFIVLFIGGTINNEFSICDKNKIYNQPLFLSNHRDLSTDFEKKTKKLPYFNHDKFSLQEYFRQNINITGIDSVTLQLQLDFIVDCNGYTGEFRWRAGDKEQSQTLNDLIVQAETQLLQVAKNMPKWNPAKYNLKNVDSFMRIYFRLRGNILFVIEETRI